MANISEPQAHKDPRMKEQSRQCLKQTGKDRRKCSKSEKRGGPTAVSEELTPKGRLGRMCLRFGSSLWGRDETIPWWLMTNEFSERPWLKDWGREISIYVLLVGAYAPAYTKHTKVTWFRNTERMGPRRTITFIQVPPKKETKGKEQNKYLKMFKQTFLRL